MGSRRAPGGGQALFEGCAGPGFIARFARRGSRVEAPDFLARQRIVRRNIAVGARAGAGASGDDFALGDDRAGGVAARIDFGLPTLFALRASRPTTALSGAV